MDDEQPHQELVKCVLVGDNAVGKTRLICAKACRQRSTLSQLLNTHVPTVWAIDQYRIYKEVLENSWTVVDGVNVSLRLWDTFGDHHKDRRFAYGRSDVILLCFDISRLSSLENCREMWYGEIKKFCPNTPVILVGCKNDVRFIFKDEQYLKYCRERSPLVRQVREHDLVMPDEGRAVAKELGLPYYETSVLTYFGVNEIFENAIRAALCARRQQRFRMTNLKRVMMPALQEPFCPPRPKLPDVTVIASSYSLDMAKMNAQQNYTDLIFLCGNVGFSAHRFMLAASSPLLRRILLTDYSQDLQTATRSNSETSLVSSNLGSNQLFSDLFNEDTECLLSSENSTPCHVGQQQPLQQQPLQQSLQQQQQQRRHNHRRRSSVLLPKFGGSLLLLPQPQPEPGVFRCLNYPALQTITIERCESLDVHGRVITSIQTLLTCSKLISPQAMNQVIQFVYSGRVETKLCNISDLKQAAEFLDIPELFVHLNSVVDNVHEDKKQGQMTLQSGLEEICLIDGLFSDILFRLDDGTCTAHKPILMARCDMMCAMFTHDDYFKEASARVVHFPGVNRFTFQELLCYLYTDKAPRVTTATCVDLIELANRLCLPRLVSLVEESVIKRLSSASDEGTDVTEDALKILQSCQVHNAYQLSEWCLAYLAQNYNLICRKYPKVLRNLHPENQATLNVNRWPPIWYLKDYDNYQRLVIDRERQQRPKNLKRTRSNSGCLCFSSNKSRKDMKSEIY